MSKAVYAGVTGYVYSKAREYLETTGTQYIDTGYKPNQNTRVVCDFELLTSSAYRTVFGTWTYSGGYKNAFTFIGYSNNRFQAYFGSRYKQFSATTTLGRWQVDFNGNVCTLGTESMTNTAGTLQTDYPLFLFASNTAGSPTERSAMRIYSCQIYDSDVLVRDFVPYVNSSGIAGMYDRANGVFYVNAGTGSFVVGAETDENAEAIYMENIARKVKGMYIGVDGIARKVKKAYIGVDGVAGYSEKNLLPFPNAVTYRGVTVTPLRDGGLHIVGTLDEGNTSALIPRMYDGSALTGSTYTLSAWTDTPVANGGLQVRLRDASSGTINNSNIAVDALHKYTNISNADITATARIAIRVVEGITYDHVIYLQLEEGSESTEFEPYEIWKNVARQFYSADFLTYDGEYEVLQVEYEGKICDLYRLKKSGILTLNDDALFWMCSGGEKGANGSYSNASEAEKAYGGRGGYGGSLISGQIASGSNWVVSIGAGGSYTGDGASSITDGTTTYKTGSRPASGYGPGGSTTSWSTAPSGGAGSGESTYPFGLTSLKAHCPGGGGAGAAIYVYSSSAGSFVTRHQGGGSGGSNGGNGTGVVGSGSNMWSGSAPGGSGGTYGGGKGGGVSHDNYTFTYTNASAAYYYGGGGGGGSAGGSQDKWQYKTGANGYQGVVYILDVNGGVPA